MTQPDECMKPGCTKELEVYVTVSTPTKSKRTGYCDKHFEEYCAEQND